VYTVSLQLPFQAQHFLIGGDWGEENHLHSHDYRAEWILEGPSLDQHGYLLDLVAVEERLGAEIGRIRGCLLNDLDAFRGLNPSVERLARHLSDRLLSDRSRWDAGRLARSTVRVWENDKACAAWTTELS